MCNFLLIYLHYSILNSYVRQQYFGCDKTKQRKQLTRKALYSIVKIKVCFVELTFLLDLKMRFNSKT